MSEKFIVAAIQLSNNIGKKDANFLAAEKLIEKAARDGAVLAALPELSTCGYSANDRIWDFGEPVDGPTAKWAAALSKRLGIYIGAGFLECDGEDFYNSYLLANPEGDIAGIIRKKDAESYSFKSAGNENRVCIQTKIGRIGVGICADGHSLEFFNKVKNANVDMLLMPHGWATPEKETKHVTQKDIDGAKETMNGFGMIYAKHLNIPVVFINSVGETLPMAGILGKYMPPEVFRLQGGSQIIDSDGTVKRALSDKEGYISAEVTVGLKAEKAAVPPAYNGWLHPGSRIVRKIIIPWDVRKGRKHYTHSSLRKEKAANVMAQ